MYRPEEGHFVAVFEDITDQKNADNTLRQMITEHQTILENVQAMIWYKDTKNTFIKVNRTAAQTLGRPIDEIEGRTFTELFPNIPDPYYQDDCEVIASKKPKIGIMEELKTAKGDHLWVQTDKIPLFDDNGNVIGVLVVSTDITERKMAKDAISQINKKLNLLSSITRHDIGNQLQLVFGYLDFTEEADLTPQVREFIEKAHVAARTIQRQIAFTKDYEEIGVYSPVWQDVGEVILHAAQQIRVGQILVSVKIAGIEAYADPLFEKVFYNIVDNSLKYGETITRIQFYGFERKEGYTIICEDDGVGIPTEYKLKIFNREYFKHTGFGLYLSREILDITGITIIETGEPGSGARFEILVPVKAYRTSGSEGQT